MVTLVILADTIDPEAQALINMTRFRKNFRLALHGWMEYHIAAMECSTSSFLSNPAGKKARKTLELNFAPRVK
jgi:S-adenosylmethionine/arginine decarboxylase-like enzyme